MRNRFILMLTGEERMLISFVNASTFFFNLALACIWLGNQLKANGVKKWSEIPRMSFINNKQTTKLPRKKRYFIRSSNAPRKLYKLYKLIPLPRKALLGGPMTLIRALRKFIPTILRSRKSFERLSAFTHFMRG